jgi:hypothetical protein
MLAGLEAGSGNAGARSQWRPAAMMVAGTLAVALASYSLSLQVASERRELERLERRTGALARELKALDSELRVRMRMPQLQRWNDDVLGLTPISATQYVADPAALASYGTPPAGNPTVHLAIEDRGLAPAPAPRLVAAPAQASRPPAAGLVAGGEAAARLPLDPLLVAAVEDAVRRAERPPLAPAPVGFGGGAP